MPKSKTRMDGNPKPMYETLLVLSNYFVQSIIASSFCSSLWVAFAQVIYVYTSCILIPYYYTLQNVIFRIPRSHYHDIEKLPLRYNSSHHLTCLIWISLKTFLPKKYGHRSGYDEYDRNNIDAVFFCIFFFFFQNQHTYIFLIYI